MSLAAPEEMSRETAFVCNKSESVLSVIEKCLDNGLGSCLVVGDDHRFIGRISLGPLTACRVRYRALARRHGDRRSHARLAPSWQRGCSQPLA